MIKWAITHKKFSPEHGHDVLYAHVIDAISQGDALARAKQMGLREVEVSGQLIAEIDTKTGARIDYDVIRNN